MVLDIDRARLQTDLQYRVAFDRDFVEFTEDDAKALHGAAPFILPVVTDVVDGVYEHLFEWSVTKVTFLERNHGFEGDLADSMENLTVEDPQMKFRKQFLSYWCAKIMTSNFDDPKIWEYLDMVGIMHIGANAFKHRAGKDPLKVDVHFLSLTLAWVTDVIISIVMEFPRSVLSTHRKSAIIRAFNKIMWIQNDLFQRHYTRTDEEAELHLVKVLNNEKEAIKMEATKFAEVRAEAERLRELKEKREAQEAVKAMPEVSAQVIDGLLG